jgi:signal transduction histidine kinase
MNPVPYSIDPRIEWLVRATPDLVSEVALERVLERVAELARALLEARYAAVGLLNPDKRTLMKFVTSGLSEEERARIGNLPTGHGILGVVIREGKVLRLPDLSAHPASIGFPPNHPPMRSFLGVPIVASEGVLGDLYLTEKIGADEFTDSDVHIALLLAGIVGSALENVRSHERTRRLLDELQHLHRSRERFFAMVNHELRNSLAAAYGWAEMQVRNKTPETAPLGAFDILDAAGQAVALINDLLDLNRLDEDRLKLIVREVDCDAVVRTVAQRVRPAADESNVHLVFSTDREPIICRTDSHRVEQILVNLLTNAIRHAPAGTPVTIDVMPESDTITFAVIDEGPGVPPDHIEHIFDIYYSTNTPDGKTGHGVGLPLSRRLARLLGGDLIAIPRPGQGGLFKLRLPIRRD